jgi:hypothetical protein
MRFQGHGPNERSVHRHRLYSWVVVGFISTSAAALQIFALPLAGEVLLLVGWCWLATRLERNGKPAQ